MENKKKYILTEYKKNDDVIFLDDFNNLEEIKKYIEKKENKTISINSLKNRKNYAENLIMEKYFITKI